MDAPTDSAARRRALMRSLERALCDALAESPALHRTLWELQREGLQVRLSIGCEPDRAADRGAARDQPSRRPSTRGTPPAFRIDSDDLLFLRSIGIDPTRSRRSRRRD